MSDEITEFVASIQEQLSEAAFGNIESLLRFGEPRVAMEHLCEYLNEDRILLAPKDYRILMALLVKLKLEPVYQTMVPVPVGASDTET